MPISGLDQCDQFLMQMVTSLLEANENGSDLTQLFALRRELLRDIYAGEVSVEDLVDAAVYGMAGFMDHLGRSLGSVPSEMAMRLAASTAQDLRLNRD